jgi:hypothetical protein
MEGLIVVLLKLLEEWPDILHFLVDDLCQKRRQLKQACVVRVGDPCFNKNTVVGLELKVFSDVVHYYCLR